MSERVPEGWESKTLETISTFRRGSFPQPYGNSEWYAEDGHPFVQVYDIDKNNKLKSKTKVQISDVAAKKSVFIPAGSVIVSLQGSIGRVAITQYDAYVDRTILIFNNFENHLNTKFFSIIIKELFQKQSELADGGIIKTITKETLKDFFITFPPLPEQKKIASILTSVDELIANTQKHIDKLQDLKKATMNELLTKGIGHTEFKDSELGQIPKSWEIGRFDNFITLQRGHDLPSQDRKDGKIPVYGSNGIVDYHIATSIDEGGVITGRSGSIGDVYFEKYKYWALNTTLYVRDFHKNDKKFIFYFLNHFNLKRFSTGTGVPTLNRNDVHLMTVAFPKLQEQVLIRNTLDKIEIHIDKKQQKHTQIQNLKKSLMQDLLTGKVKVSIN